MFTFPTIDRAELPLFAWQVARLPVLQLKQPRDGLLRVVSRGTSVHCYSPCTHVQEQAFRGSPQPVPTVRVCVHQMVEMVRYMQHQGEPVATI